MAHHFGRSFRVNNRQTPNPLIAAETDRFLFRSMSRITIA
jgi:hypothetical protein